MIIYLAGMTAWGQTQAPRFPCEEDDRFAQFDFWLGEWDVRLTTAPFRGLWTPLEDGRVRQFFEQFDEESGEWQPWFDGFYARRQANQAE